MYRAWKDNLRRATQIPSYAVLRALASHEDRAKIIQQNPKLTYREALNIMRKAKTPDAEYETEGDEGPWQKHSTEWFAQVVISATGLIDALAVIENCTPEQQENLLLTVEEYLVEKIQDGGRAGVRIADWLDERLEAATKKELAKQKRLRKAPKPALLAAPEPVTIQL
jgi:hypothetical protein